MSRNVAELINLLKSKPEFDRDLAGQILLSKAQIKHEQIYEVYDVAQQKKELDHTIVNYCLFHFARNGNAAEAQNLINRALGDGMRYHKSWYTIMASAHAADKDFKKAFSTLNMMKGVKGYTVYVPLFPSLIKTLGASKSGLAWCLDEFFQIVKNHIEVPSKVYCSLISQFGKAGDIDVCIQLFEEMKQKGVKVNETVYTTVIDAYARTGNMKQCEKIFKEMKQQGITISDYPYNTLIKGFGKLGDMERCKELVKEMEIEGVKPTTFTFGIMMDAYKRIGQLEKCVEMFQEMEQRDLKPNVVIYTTLIGAYGQAGDVEECEKLYKEMQLRGIQPTETTYNTMAGVFDRAARQQEGNLQIVEKSLMVGFLLPFML